MERIICFLIGYVLGNLQTSYIYGKMNGIDIREHGSGNAGTTNALRVLGRKAGLVVFFFDVAKCAVAMFLVRIFFGEAQPDMIYLYMIYAALGTILGHNYPIILGFRGGKGIACTAGIILFYHPVLIPVGVLLFFGCFLFTNYVSLGSLATYLGFFITIIILGQTGLLGAMPAGNLYEIYGIALFLTIMAFWKHRQNISRLLKGTESKTYLSKKKKA